MPNKLRHRCIGMALLMLVVLPSAAAAQCTPIKWPASNPVWSLCFVSPEQSSGIDGSGLEILNVFYKGRRVLDRAHVPIFNVLYDASACQQLHFCGFPGRAYRDANNLLRAFDASVTPPRTVCDHPLTDGGNFSGVKVDAGDTTLTLTTQTYVGWYRYPQSWTFFLDGRIHAGVGFTAVKHPCTSCSHTHNAYLRFDFDIGGSLSNVLEASPPGQISNWRAVLQESAVSRNTASKWRVVDANSGIGYQIVPDPADLGGTGAADAFAVADGWVLAFHSEELDDGGAAGLGIATTKLEFRGDEAHVGEYVNGETVNQHHVVLWYRVGKRHSGSPSCLMAGPTLVPEPGWDRPLATLRQLAVSMTPSLVTVVGAATRVVVHAEDAVTHAKVNGTVLLNGGNRGMTNTPLSLMVCVKEGAPKGQLREVQGARITVTAPGYEEALVEFSCRGEAP